MHRPCGNRGGGGKVPPCAGSKVWLFRPLRAVKRWGLHTKFFGVTCTKLKWLSCLAQQLREQGLRRPFEGAGGYKASMYAIYGDPSSGFCFSFPEAGGGHHGAEKHLLRYNAFLEWRQRGLRTFQIASPKACVVSRIVRFQLR